MKSLFVIWILLQLSSSGCNGMAVKPMRRDGHTNGLEAMMDEEDMVKEQTSSLNEVQIVEYEDTDDHHKTYTSTSLLSECEPCPQGILCVPQIQCPAHVRLQGHEKPQVCDLPGGDKFGFCCVTGQNHTATKPHKARIRGLHIIPPKIIEEARLKFQNLMHKIAMIATTPGRPEFTHGMVFHSSHHEDLQNFHLTNMAMEQLIAMQVLSKNELIPVEDIITNNVELEFGETPLAHNCQRPTICISPLSRYRKFDGSCNNLHPLRSLWGSAGQPMERLLPPAYEDGIWLPRQFSKDGSLLANARDISRIVMTDADRTHPKHNLLLMQFGQFLAHDVSQSASVRLENGETVQCCAAKNAAILPPQKRHFACMPIELSEHDEFYNAFGDRCMNFVRLALAPNFDCRASYGKQRNKVTHFLDASAVYGSSAETAWELRTFSGGKLKMLNEMGHNLLPLTQDRQACDSNASGRTCFKSGDGRTNQIISLIAIHILFAREHNRIADILARLNPHASDQTLYQEARRIVIAELQHIVYNEYLPAVIGPLQMKRFRLNTKHKSYSSDYNDKVNPGVTNEFSGAAFRMGHSSVDGRFRVQQQHGKNDEIIDIPDVMFNPIRMRNRTFYDDILKTMLVQPMQKVDSFITYGLSRFLFRGRNSFGLDLAAFNIQRGRDMGLRSYNDYLEVMGNRRIHSFSQLPLEVGRKLSLVYRSPDDIDLWVGGLLEKPLKGGIVGNTFSEIIADQFSRFKLGDRYYYEYNKSVNPGAFTIDQLNEIRKVTMARIICDNADHFTLNFVSPMAFVRADYPGNQPLRCDSHRIPNMNMNVFLIR